MVRGLGRGLAGAVGLPVSGALAAIEALTSGIAAASGVSPIAVAQCAVPDPGAVANWCLPGSMCGLLGVEKLSSLRAALSCSLWVPDC